jgi:calcium-dependent protein kinase
LKSLAPHVQLRDANASFLPSPIALGVITFLLLCGETPFGGLDGENMQLVKQNIMRAQVQFAPKAAWDLVSEKGKSFVSELLKLDSSKRPTAKEAQQSQWIQQWAKKDIAEGNTLHPKTIGALTNFKESSEMQRLLSEVLSFTLLPDQIVDLRKEFEKLDSNGDGEITLESLKCILIENAEVGVFGTLSEREVEEIFESVKLPVRKGERTIRWHEFLAACLSRAEIDDRNLRLAFDRLDTERKGYVFLSLLFLLPRMTQYLTTSHL